MTLYEFVPNLRAIEVYKLALKKFTGHGITAVLQEAFGEEMYEKYIPLQPALIGSLDRFS